MAPVTIACTMKPLRRHMLKCLQCRSLCQRIFANRRWMVKTHHKLHRNIYNVSQKRPLPPGICWLNRWKIKSTDFINFWCSVSSRNMTMTNDKVAQLTCLVSPHYLVKCKKSFQLHYFYLLHIIQVITDWKRTSAAGIKLQSFLCIQLTYFLYYLFWLLSKVKINCNCCLVRTSVPQST